MIFFNLPNPSSRTMPWVFNQPLTEMIIRKSTGKARPTRKADNLTAIWESIVQKMWNSLHLTTL
jgi:hypothetical protein